MSDLVEMVNCDINCHGEKDLCIFKIMSLVKNGKIPCMIFANHVKGKLEKLGYIVTEKRINNIPVLMYISK